MVLSRDQNDGADGKVVASRVSRMFVHQVDHTVLVTLSNGERIECTDNHPFFVPGIGWVPAGKLCLGTQVTPRAGPTAAGLVITVASVAPLAAKAGVTKTVYNFEVQGTHTYFVGTANGGEWVHNACGLFSMITRRGLRNSSVTVDGMPHRTGVPFPDGFPDFSGHLYPGGMNTVAIRYTGSYGQDFADANAAAGYASTPNGYTWHHMQDMRTMQLVDRNIHRLTGHTGGVSLWEALTGRSYGP